MGEVAQLFAKDVPMSIKLQQILSLVGKLDDSPGEDTARERFRRFLKDNILEVGLPGPHRGMPANLGGPV